MQVRNGVTTGRKSGPLDNTPGAEAYSGCDRGVCEHTARVRYCFYALQQPERNMKRNSNLRRLGDTLVAGPTYLAIFLVGLQYSFYKVFSLFRLHDDEGTMMLRVQAFIKDPASYDSLSGMYGPLYYLHKYAIYGVLQADVSHDINRLTTIVLWGMIAAACAFFVHRVSRSIVLAAVVHMQLILHLTALTNEPGHPHEIALLLIAGALVLSSFVDTRRVGLMSMMGLGAATGALLLVKVNLGVYLGASLALALLLFLPRNTRTLGLGWLMAAVAIVLPAAIMWRHLHTPWGRNYCALVTMVIAASLVMSSRRSEGGTLRWAHVSGALSAAAITIGSVCAVIICWGNSLWAIANSVFLRAATLPSSFVILAPVSVTVARASAASLLLALCYTLAAPKIRGREFPVVALSVVKLAYAGFAFYSLNRHPAALLLHTIPIPFLWLVLVEPNAKNRKSARELFPRVFLCLLAAFQTLQAYPVHGSQSLWAAFLVVPVAAICVGDALRSLWDVAKHRLRRTGGWRIPAWLQPTFTLLLLCSVGATYYAKANLAGLEVAYAQRVPLDLPGASRIRLLPFEVDQIHWPVENLKSYCDGFIGLPGFASLYFWTEIPPPGTINNAWILNLDDDRQRAIIETMRTYDRPCVLHNPRFVSLWTRGRSLDSKQPLVQYIQTQYKPLQKHGPYSLLVRKDRPIDIEPNRSGT